MQQDERRRWFVFGTVLVVAGAGLAWLIARPMFLREGEERVQIEDDAVSLSQVIHYGAPPHAEDAAWSRRKERYSDEMLAKLRDSLNAFVEFEVAEFGDAKDVYLSGVRPEIPSDAARAAEERLRAAFPRHADDMIKQFRDGVVEQAYKASPKIGGGVDPDLPRYDRLYDAVVKDFLPDARKRIVEMTSR